MTATLGPDVDNWTFKFDFDQEPSVMEILRANVPAIVGLVLLFVALALAFTYTESTPLQSQLIRSTAALGLGGIASLLTGFLRVKVNFGSQLGVTAAGALAVYVISFFFVPAG